MINKSRQAIEDIRRRPEAERHQAANRLAVIIISILILLSLFVLLPLQLYLN